MLEVVLAERVQVVLVVAEMVQVAGCCVAVSCAHLLRLEMVLTFLVLKPFTRSISRKLLSARLSLTRAPLPQDNG